MDADILCTLLAQRIPPINGVAQFQVRGTEVVFFDPDEGVNKPIDSPHESPYDTPENRASVAGVIANYDTLEAEYLISQEPTYEDLRRAEYPPDGDQFDNITKALKYLKDNGIDIGPDGEKQVDDCFAVKNLYPKD